MSATEERVVFQGDNPVEARTIRVWRLRGTGGGPSAYLQAGVHADELPGMLVLHRLLPLLEAEADAGRLRGDITVVPQANPIGQRQQSGGRVLGRFHAATGQNFNRGFSQARAAAIPGVAAWQATLLRLAAGADLVLDLHTDDEALPYAYIHAALWPAATDLVAALGIDTVILWQGDGGGAFEDTIVSGWLAAGSVAGRVTATVELRGQADVDDALADRDARGLLRFLRARGVIAGEADIRAWGGAAIPIDHVQTIRAPHAGVLVFRRALGQTCAAGDAVARLVPIPGDPGADHALVTLLAGRLFARTRDRFAPAGGVVAKLTGTAPSPSAKDGPLDD